MPNSAVRVTTGVAKIGHLVSVSAELFKLRPEAGSTAVIRHLPDLVHNVVAHGGEARPLAAPSRFFSRSGRPQIFEDAFDEAFQLLLVALGVRVRELDLRRLLSTMLPMCTTASSSRVSRVLSSLMRATVPGPPASAKLVEATSH